MPYRTQSAFRAALIVTCSAAAFSVAASHAHAGSLINGDSLLISTTTYQDTGAAAGLVAGASQLPGANAGQTSTAVANGSLNTVWNNASVDASFGVTSEITISDLNTTTATAFANLNLNTSQVVTSFSSKSELGLNLVKTASGPVLTFMGYNVSTYDSQNGLSNGLGLLDVSNSDTTAYSDPTNPVGSFYGAKSAGGTYAFNRSVVAVNANGSYNTTQTLAYGGNNGRNAVLAPNGLYYTVGNSNNGSGAPTQLTTTTGAEAVNPGSTPNSTMIAPNYQSISGDKAGKDNNFRGLTLYNGQLYFSKGSGSNGIDTVYTVTAPKLPTPGQAASATVSILPGFPTDHAKKGPNFTPFGLFFANPDTLYVADEGSGDSIDVAQHAGLEKWSLVKGTWELDYTLQSGLIGDSYGVAGWNYNETVTGLRNLTAKIDGAGDITFWATTAVISGSGDNGADPNQIVEITDALAATTLPTTESFSVFDPAKAGLRYGGVAFAAPEPSTWAMMALGFIGLGFLAQRSAKARAAVA
jgi:hypothetical protein